MASPPLKLVKPNKETGTSVDTILVTKAVVKTWKLPPFQRPLKANAKVVALAEQLKHNGGVFPGILTIGVLGGHRYLVDGQHRCHAFELSGIDEGYSDVRFRHYDSIHEMADDFVSLNSSLVKMGPDDILRGLESSSEALTLIRQKCAFVGYDQIRRGTAAPVVSMSAALRCWNGASRDIPASVGASAAEMAKTFAVTDAEELVTFLNLAMRAWGRDPEYFKLWGNLNLTMCMWIYKRVVLRSWSAKSPRITKEVFGKLLAALSADTAYLEWLLGRQMGDRDRSPGYRRIKAVFVKRLEMELGRKVNFPAPEWVSN